MAEGALLAGLVKAPSNYAPTVNLERAIAPRTVVLQAMLDSGVIDQRRIRSARIATKVTLTDSLRNEEPYGRFFKEHVRRELVNRFGDDRVYEGGLEGLHHHRPRHAARRRCRSAARAQGSRHAPQLAHEAPPANPAALQASLVAIDPRTGEVRALIGGRDFIQSNFNRAIYAKRQPGSAFKPFVYAAALEAGFTPATLIYATSTTLSYTVQGAWIPEDDHSSATVDDDARGAEDVEQPRRRADARGPGDQQGR